MGKFKVGDRVRRIETHNADNMQIGDTGVVTGVAADGGVMVKPDRGGTTQYNFGFYLELVPTITITPGKHYRLKSGKVTGRITEGDIGFEATVDGSTKVFDKAGGAVFGDDHIVEAWAPKVGERVVNNENTRVDIVRHWNQHFRAGNGSIIDGALVVASVADRGTSNIGLSNKVGRSFFFMPADTLQPAAPAQPAVLKIEAGRYYKTRDGRKVGPMTVSVFLPDLFAAVVDDINRVFQPSGTHGSEYIPNNPDYDLIAEWIDEPTVEASNDNAAPAKFKVGDTVRALVDWGSVKKGDVRTVPHIDADGEVWFTPDGFGGWEDYFEDSELELVTSQPAIVALIEDGAAKPSSKPKVHASQEDATVEAERLALAHPGQLFGVFVLADSKIADVVNVPTPVLRAA